MPKLNDLKPGDLISDIDDDDHFMIWVGGEEPLVENVEADDFSGIFRHSASKIRKRIAERDEDEEEGFDVFRCENQAIAQQAADFAIEWSTGKTDPKFQEGKKSGRFFNLKIPFNQDRLTHDRQQKPEEWDVRSLFRALRVLSRQESRVNVSIKGWTCSSFVTYCFQAAALKVLFNNNKIPKNLLDTVRRSGHEGFLSIKNNFNLIELALSEQTDIIRKLVPTGILVDGKAIDATALRNFLNKPGNDFIKLGNIT